MAAPPLIGITCDVIDDRYAAGVAYARIVAECGGTPILLPCIPTLAATFADRCDGFILTGGDDPIMEHWGIATHPEAKKIDPQRQAFEIALLDKLRPREETPVLGVCLGMQLMALHAGGELDQHLPDSLATASQHWGRVPHEVSGDLGSGVVLSHHRQAIIDAGTMRTIATAPDGVIEAIDDPHRRFYIGVQWHPERTEDETLGRAIIRRLVEEAAVRR